MNDLNEIEVRLWEYIDGFSDAQEKSAIEKLIAENAEWKAKYHELLEVHQSYQFGRTGRTVFAFY